MSEQDEKEVLIPEVLPPESGERPRDTSSHDVPPPRTPEPESPMDRAFNAFAPVFAGVLVDVVSFATYFVFGFFAGLFAGFWFSGICRMRFKHRVFAAIIGGYYCSLGIPKFLPVATVAGIYFAFKNAGRKTTP